MCVLFFTCTLVNCGLTLLLHIVTLPRDAQRWPNKRRRRKTRRRPQKQGRSLQRSRKCNRMDTQIYGQAGSESWANQTTTWLIGVILLAVNPCTAVLFPTEYYMMLFILFTIPCAGLVLSVMLIVWLLLLNFTARYGAYLYHTTRPARRVLHDRII